MNRRAFLQLSTPPRPDVFPPLPRRTPKAPRRRTVAQAAPPLAPLHVEAGLEPYAAPLDGRRAAHLLRRTGFGAKAQEVDALTGMTADAVVDMLVDEAFGLPLPEPPPWADAGVPRDRADQEQYVQDNVQWLFDYRIDWLMRMYYGGLRERLTLFWSNHFVTESEVYFLAPFAYRYVTLLRTHALGNFKDFVRAVGIDPAMLIYLNGASFAGPGNIVGEPNENYSRELLELFTMGQLDGQGNENYTQADIEELARALTGWVVNIFDLNVQHVSLFFDNGDKTIFGRTEGFDYDGVVDLIFEERGRQVAEFVCGKLYREFVYAASDDALVAEMADVFMANDYEIAPVLRTLFKSAHFLDEQVVGAQIKSPVTMLTGFLQETFSEDPPDNLFMLLDRFAFFMNQYLLDPPNVAGWEGHHSWLNTTTLPVRWLITEFLVYGSRNQLPIDLVPLAEYLLARLDEPVNPGDPVSAFKLPLALAEHLLPVPVETLDLNAPSDGFAGDLVGNPIPDEILNGPAYVLDLAKIFLAGVPWYEWNLYAEGAPALLLYFTRSLTQTPEFQLT